MKFAFARDERGTVAIIAAAAMAMLMSLGAIAIDIGMLYVERRHAQGAVDLAAMAAASDIPNATTAAEKILSANGIETYTKLDVVTGHYRADVDLAPELRFVPGMTPLNAARVTLRKPGTTYFAKVFDADTVHIGVTGVAASPNFATFSAGTRLLAIRDGLSNRFLGALIGGDVDLSVADYEALLDAKIDVLDFLRALNTQASLQAASYNDVLSGEVTGGDIAHAAAEVADQNGDTQASAALETIASAQSHGAPVNLKSLIDLGPIAQTAIGTKAPGMDATLGALELVTTSAVIANGKNQVAVDLGLSMPGLSSVKLDIAIGESPVRSPWVRVGEYGSLIYTAQIRIRLIAEVGGIGAISGLKVRVPIYVEAAHATARLSEIVCQNPKSVSVAAKPGVVTAHLADVVSFGSTAASPSVNMAQLVATPFANVRGRATIAAENVDETDLTFTEDDISQQAVKRTGTSDMTQSLVTGLLRNVRFDVQALGFSLAIPGGLTSSIANTLQTAAAPLDALLYDVLTTLGIRLGEVDVRVHGLHCGRGGVLTG